MKNLPYFKFDAESWLTGKIQLLPVEEIGIFVNLMARIWKAGGSLKNDRFLPRMLGTDKEHFTAAFNDFVELEIIEEIDGYIHIKFITAQLADRAAFIDRCAAAGRKGREATPKQPPSNPEATPEVGGSNKNEKIEEKNKNEIKGNPLSPANLERVLGLDNAADFKRWLTVWRDTNGDGKDMTEIQQENNLRLLVSLPDIIRATVLDKAIRGAWYALHDIRDGNGKAPPSNGKQTGTLHNEPQYSNNERGRK